MSSQPNGDDIEQEVIEEVEPDNSLQPAPYCGFSLGLIGFLIALVLYLRLYPVGRAVKWSILWGIGFSALGAAIGHIGHLLILEMYEEEEPSEEEQEQKKEEEEEDSKEESDEMEEMEAKEEKS